MTRFKGGKKRNHTPMIGVSGGSFLLKILIVTSDLMMGFSDNSAEKAECVQGGSKKERIEMGR